MVANRTAVVRSVGGSARWGPQCEGLQSDFDILLDTLQRMFAYRFVSEKPSPEEWLSTITSGLRTLYHHRVVGEGGFYEE